MRTTIWLILGLIFIAFITAFFIDSRLYYYGKSKWSTYDKLPFKVTPQYWGTDRGMIGFVLSHYDETLIGKGNKYFDYPKITVSEVIKYGFNEGKIVALVNDSLGKEYYVVCTKNNEINSKQDLKITIVGTADFINNDQLKWIHIKNVTTDKIELARNFSGILLILLIFILIGYSLKKRKETTLAFNTNKT